GLHAWANQLIENRGGQLEVEPKKTDAAFQQAWHHAGGPLTLGIVSRRAPPQAGIPEARDRAPAANRYR
uniref:hypothetical protein n=1 Tax=Nocardia cyriacigeorgica TaxID=135487 RepID=UPI002455A127